MLLVSKSTDEPWANDFIINHIPYSHDKGKLFNLKEWATFSLRTPGDYVQFGINNGTIGYLLGSVIEKTGKNLFLFYSASEEHLLTLAKDYLKKFEEFIIFTKDFNTLSNRKIAFVHLNTILNTTNINQVVLKNLSYRGIILYENVNQIANHLPQQTVKLSTSQGIYIHENYINQPT